MLLSIFLILVGVLMVLLGGFFVVQFYNMFFRGFAPFVSTHPSVIDLIRNEIKLAQGQKVYELGSGNAGFLLALEKEFPQADFTGIEYALWPWLTAKIQLVLNKSKVKLIKENFLKVDLSGADLIYCYLNPKTMKLIAEKIKKECKLGTTLISYTFPVTDWQPTKTHELADGTRVFFYKY